MLLWIYKHIYKGLENLLFLYNWDNTLYISLQINNTLWTSPQVHKYKFNSFLKIAAYYPIEWIYHNGFTIVVLKYIQVISSFYFGCDKKFQ